ncbi:hypothetical protein OG455_06825 [Kitasatospora sp. NBC_01287]|uniref:hypothetical protein n=1 Tax=Kitasatospora sp. NBC_01287 TaxID=2903573 RepID=UPI00224E4103|nr:hypothetical protein [Kitasatospora sp. NBC_01287]MCX4745237.1 hypothetical protein [Kitasatospora sp. NBC_01287]
MRVRRGGRDRGTISIFVAFSVSAMLVFMGIVLDCGGRLNTLERADAMAEEAARVGGQQIDQGSVLGGKTPLIDTKAAQAAATAYLQQTYGGGLTAEWPDPGNPPPADAPSVTFVVNITYRTTLLGLFNTPTLPVQGIGTATPVLGNQKAGGA